MTARRTPIIWLICPAATEMREGTSEADPMAREYRNIENLHRF